MTKRAPFSTFVIPDTVDATRLDAFIAGCLDGVSRHAVKQMLAEGAITVNGRRASGGRVPIAGSTVAVWTRPASAGWTPKPDATIPLDVCFADADLLVVAKPSGIPSVPLRPDETGTMAGAVAFRYPECAGLGRSAGDGGLLQRLDRDTSGAVMVARNRDAFDALVDAQRRGRVEKRYLALVPQGGAIPDTVDTPLAPSGRKGRRMRSAPDGLAARTWVRVLAENASFRLLEATIHRGVRHQIRAHLAAVGAPIVGDAIYGGTSRESGCARLFLHAHRVSFVHPRGGQPLCITVPMPDELSKFVEKNLIISF